MYMQVVKIAAKVVAGRFGADVCSWRFAAVQQRHTRRRKCLAHVRAVHATLSGLFVAWVEQVAARVHVQQVL